MTDPVTCDECRHFQRDEINPVEGLGFCPLRRVSKYPMAPHYCRWHLTSQGWSVLGGEG